MDVRISTGLLGLAVTSFVWCADTAYAAPPCGLYQYRAIVRDVLDGETITADLDLGFYVWRHRERMRLFGVDAPSLEGAEKAQAQKARDGLSGRILGKELVICTVPEKGSFDPLSEQYGRFLAKVYLGDESINEWMVSEGLATVANDQ